MKNKPTESALPETYRPFLRWAGSKKQLLPELSKYWNESYNRYVEPFAGSACLFFRLKPKAAILGDINQDLISTYLEVKYRLPDLIKELQQLKKGREEYLELRKRDISSMDSAQKAARFIYLNRFCFNGLYRTNQKGQFNVPYGGEKSGNIPSEEQLKNCSKLLKCANLVPGSFEKVLEKAKLGDFVYMDPPFSVKARRVFNEYNAASFGDADLKTLKQWMTQLADRNIAFLISYAESDEANFLKTGFPNKVVSVKRHIAGFTGSRIRAKEVLISSRL
jgi:DNA adenine methylase